MKHVSLKVKPMPVPTSLNNVLLAVTAALAFDCATILAPGIEIGFFWVSAGVALEVSLYAAGLFNAGMLYHPGGNGYLQKAGCPPDGHIIRNSVALGLTHTMIIMTLIGVGAFVDCAGITL
jgi:hypothetical protein